MEPTTFTEARIALENGETSCRELVSSFLRRIDDLNGELNAFVRVDSERAIARAEELDRERRRGKAGDLAGLVVGVKDVIARENRPLSCGSRILEGFTSIYTATAVERLEGRGAVVIGETNCDEFAMGSSNEHSVHGPVRNPVDPERVPGGSSGGSAAAVAAGMCHAALGSDTGGSVRQPAAFCGVVGMKPTYGRVSRHGLVAYASSFDGIGPIARSLDDAAVVLAAISGRDVNDATSMEAEPVSDHIEERASLEGVRIGVAEEYMGEGLDAEIRDAVDGAAKSLEARGAEIVSVSLPRTEYGVAAYYVLVTAEASSNLARYDGARYGFRTALCEGDSLKEMYERTRSEGFGPEVKRRIMLGTYVLSAGYYEAYYDRASRVRRLIREDFEKAFEGVDALLTPTTPSTAFRLGEQLEDPLQMYLGDVYTVTANLAGIPGLSVPFGRDRRRLPIGVQLLGPHFSENDLLSIGKVLEANAPSRD